MVVLLRDRSDAMLRRVLGNARGRGVTDTELLEAAIERAMAPRFAKLDDDHDPRFLHPGRTALILMDDVGFTDPRGLAAAILAETESPELASPNESQDDDSPDLRAALADARGLPSMEQAEELAEALLTAPEPLPVIALAEHLDQLRHLRLWAEADRLRARGRIAARVLVPMADRVHPVMARRLRWWVRRVAARTGD